MGPATIIILYFSIGCNLSRRCRPDATFSFRNNQGGWCWLDAITQAPVSCIASLSFPTTSLTFDQSVPKPFPQTPPPWVLPRLFSTSREEASIPPLLPQLTSPPVPAGGGRLHREGYNSFSGYGGGTVSPYPYFNDLGFLHSGNFAR